MFRCSACDMAVESDHFSLYHRCWKCREQLEAPYRTCSRCGEEQRFSEDVTPEMVLAVRRRECSFRGHSWQIIETFGVGPTQVFCSNCGEDSGLVRPLSALQGLHQDAPK